MDLTPAYIAGAGAELHPSATGSLCEYRVTGMTGAVKMELLPGRINGVSERGALCEYRRIHVSLDSYTAGYEFSNRIPFGAEYKFRRIMELGDGWGTVSCDAAVAGPGNVQSLELGDVVLHGAWSGCRFAFADGRVENVVILPAGSSFSSVIPWRAVELTDSDGNRFEIGTGDDWWRWVQPEDSGSEYSLEIGDGKAVFRRKIFDIPVADIPEEEQIRRKSWRCQWYWAWCPAGMADADMPEAADIGIAAGCCKAPGFQRAVRNAVRKNSASGVIGVARTGDRICPEASHLERPAKKELLHFDRCEALKTYLWANRRIAANGGSGFVWLTAESGGSKLFAAEKRMKFVPADGFYSPARETGEIE